MSKIRGKQIADNEVTATQADTTSGAISTVNAGDSAVEGSGAGLSRRDHQHAVSTAAAVELTDATNAEGGAASLARSDHTHSHGSRGGGTLHAVVIAGGAAGFMDGADKTKLDGIDAGAEVNDTPQQESVATEVISGSDTALADVLNNTPVSDDSVVLYLNGLQQQQGAGFDYTLSGTTITWLASTGTAVDMDTADVLIATYLS